MADPLRPGSNVVPELKRSQTPLFKDTGVMEMPENQDSDLPLQLRPVYSTATANAPVTLYEGGLVLQQEPKTLTGSGTVELDWLPRPKLRFEFYPGPESGQRAELKGASLCMPDADRQAEVTVTKLKLANSQTSNVWTASGAVRAFEIGKDRELRSIVFHIVNFRSYVGRPVLDIDGSTSTRRGLWKPVVGESRSTPSTTKPCLLS